MTTAPQPRAILFGLEHPQSIAALRSFAALGIPTVGITTRTIWRARSSRYLKETHRVGDDPGETLSLLKRLGDEGGTLIPLNDDWLLFLSQNHHLLAEKFVVCAPPWPVLEPLVDQRLLYVLARECGLKAPTFYTPRDEAEMRAVVAGLDLANQSFLLKSRLGHRPAVPAIGRFTKLAGTDRKTIEENCLEMFGRIGEFPLIAEVIPGPVERSVGVTMVVDQNQEPVLSYALQRLKLHLPSHGGRPAQPFEIGANAFCETVQDDEAIEAAIRLVRATSFVGAITLEFRRDSRDNSLVLVKADPRMVGPTGLSSALGRDLTAALYNVVNGMTTQLTNPPALGIGWIWLPCYLDSLWRQRSYRPISRELAALAIRVLRIRSIAFWDIRNPLPFFVDFSAWIWTLVRSGWRRAIG